MPWGPSGAQVKPTGATAIANHRAQHAGSTEARQREAALEGHVCGQLACYPSRGRAGWVPTRLTPRPNHHLPPLRRHRKAEPQNR